MSDTRPITPPSPQEYWHAGLNECQMCGNVFEHVHPDISNKNLIVAPQSGYIASFKQEPSPQDKITCTACGRENVPDWDGKGHCITCARDLVLGASPPADDAASKVSNSIPLDDAELTNKARQLQECEISIAEFKEWLLEWHTKPIPQQVAGDDAAVVKLAEWTMHAEYNLRELRQKLRGLIAASNKQVELRARIDELDRLISIYPKLAEWPMFVKRRARLAALINKRDGAKDDL